MTTNSADALRELERLTKATGRAREAFERMHQEMSAASVSGQAGGGLVRATVDGRGSLQSLAISSAAADPERVDELADLVLRAVGNATASLAQRYRQHGDAALGALSREMGRGRR